MKEEKNGEVTEINGEELLIACSVGALSARAFGEGMEVGQECAIGIRPEDLSIATNEDAKETIYEGRLESAQFVGEAHLLKVLVGDEILSVKTHRRQEYTVGQSIRIDIPPEFTIAVKPDTSSETIGAAEKLILGSTLAEKSEQDANAG